ncbi:serine/threonine-protein kinase [Streptomyces sp. enrichment culture]|uniref:serine/threonine-protein kinase n=1 Tax=Streptomyces sp. enrichment culture TaxID=1795815 RepID=UPI003F57EB22
MSSGEYGQTEGVGRVLAGRYRVTARLGRGGMGVVWRAVDEVLGREVAVKELRTYTDSAGPELSDLRLRMQREARAAARVRHPGVIAVHDIAEVDGRPLIVMELVDGPSLDDVLRERGTLDPREAAGIGAKVMDALAAAHRVGVLHRDVKPGNILLDRSGRVVLTDFGIATMDDPGDGSETHLTRSGEIVGSLDYLAPERAQGGLPGPASDIWALGATLYAAVEGASPFRRTSTYSTLTAIVAEPLPEAHRAGPLGPVLTGLMAKHPDARPDADRAREQLEAVASGAVTDLPTASLHGCPAATAASARAETELSVPSVPPGFGPAYAPADGTGHPASPAGNGHADPFGNAGHAGTFRNAGHVDPFGNAGHADPFGNAGHADPFGNAGHLGPLGDAGNRAPAGAPAPAADAAAPRDPAPPRRKRGRALLAAVAVTVVLAAAGVTVALFDTPADDDTEPVAASGASAAAISGSASVSDPESARAGTDAEASPEDSAEPSEKGEDPSPSASRTTDDEEPAEPTGRATTAAPSKSPTAGSGGGDEPGTGGGATTQAPAPVCHPVGGGKYNCQVWRTATSYTASGTEAGVLYAGTNYFYCQQNLGRRETYGEWTNVWWARTDDDSGNTNVYVSDVYIQGGDNDAPVPGLPVC